MPVAKLTALRRIEVDDAPVPEPGEGEVLLEMSAVGICGSDLHYWRCGRIGDQVIKFPQGIGHEPAGIVAATGRGVRHIREGARVAVEPGITCGHCRPCRMGRANLCPNVRFLGAPGQNGAFGRYLVMPATHVEVLPESVNDRLGCASELLGVAMQGFDLVGLKSGETVAIVGGGPVGLCVAALARAQGARVVSLAEPRAPRRAVAEKLGVDRVTGGDVDAFVQATLDATDGEGADVTVECAGEQQTLDTCIQANARGGRVALIGIPEVDTLPVDPHHWRRKELAIHYVRRSNQLLERGIRLLAQNDLGLEAAGFFSGEVPLGGIQDAMERLEDTAGTGVKYVVDPRLS